MIRHIPLLIIEALYALGEYTGNSPQSLCVLVNLDVINIQSSHSLSSPSIIQEDEINIQSSHSLSSPSIIQKDVINIKSSHS